MTKSDSHDDTAFSFTFALNGKLIPPKGNVG